MTLVVARRSSFGVHVLSDLRISHPEERRDGLPHGALKAVLLNEDVCACFAGSLALGGDAIAELARQGDGLDADGATSALYEVHKAHSDRTEFLVVCRSPVRFLKVAERAIEESETSAWIGDHAAFSAFQALCLGPPLSPRFELPPEVAARVDPQGDRDDFVQQMDALREVIADPSIETVGDARVVVRGNEAEGFGYRPYMEMDNGLDPPAIHAVGGEEVNILRAGTAAIGAYAYSVLVPKSPGVGVLGVHVLQANLGFLYHPAVSETAAVYSSVTPQEFIAAVVHEHGVELTGIVFTSRAP